MFPLAASPVGNNVLLIVGPVILVLGIIAFVVATTVIARKRGRPAGGPGEGPRRGAVQGGMIEGDPGQRNRRDENNRTRLPCILRHHSPLMFRIAIYCLTNPDGCGINSAS